jgi:hypothetical protein
MKLSNYMLNYLLNPNSLDTMPARHFYLVESEFSLTRPTTDEKQKCQDPSYEDFTKYIHYRKPLKNQWHMPRPNSNASYNSSSSSNTKSNNSHDSNAIENIYEQVMMSIFTF